MHAIHARVPKNFVLEERLERYADVIELEPRSWAGHWAEGCWLLGGEEPTGTATTQAGRFREVRLDLGCGKGAFLVESARREPDVLFMGIDAEPLCIAYAAQHVFEAGLANAVLVPGVGKDVREFFCAGELAAVYLNFPTPFPRKKEARKRLVDVERLMDYREVLAPDGFVRLRTDSQPLRDFSLTQFELAGYELAWSSDDARADYPDEPSSEYEERLSAQGAKVLALQAVPAWPAPEHVEQTAELSLATYLPQDLQSLEYVPHGMQGTVTNLRNRAIHEAAQAAVNGASDSD